jgi:hypothetical protein
MEPTFDQFISEFRRSEGMSVKGSELRCCLANISANRFVDILGKHWVNSMIRGTLNG